MINMILTKLCALAIVAQVQAPSISTCFDAIDSRLSKAAAAVTSSPLGRIQEVKDACTIGDKTAWEQLRRTLTNDMVPSNVRSESLRIACAIADEEIANELIGIMLGWLAEAEKLARPTLPTDRTWAGLPDKHGNHMVLVGIVAIDGFDQLMDVMPDCELAFALTEAIYTAKALHLRRFRWWDVLDACQDPKSKRQSFALTMLRNYSAASATYASIVSLDDSGFREDLRNLFREPANNQKKGGGIYAGVAAALAYLGDEEILNDLKALREPFKDNPTMRLFIKHSIQKIEMQHPPKKLLEYIASDEDPYVDVRTWAIKRAVEIGLPKSEIRDAILAHAPQCETLGRGPRPNMRPDMIPLRRIGISLGILKAYDLPSEDIPPSRRVE